MSQMRITEMIWSQNQKDLDIGQKRGGIQRGLGSLFSKSHSLYHP